MATATARTAPGLTFGSWAAILSAWNLFVWGGRIRNILADPSVVPTWSILASLGFTAAALAVLGFWGLRWRKGEATEGAGRWIALAAAAAGIALWTFRAIVIALADYSPAFVAVHTVLAVVSVILGVMVLRSSSPVLPSGASTG